MNKRVCPCCGQEMSYETLKKRKKALWEEYASINDEILTLPQAKA